MGYLKLGRDLHADFPAPEGPMSNSLRVGKESSDAMFRRRENMVQNAQQ